MITRALGISESVEPDIYVKTFLKEDVLLMTTDGLTNMVKEEEIFNIINKNIDDAAKELVNKANENGGLDNITVVVISKP